MHCIYNKELFVVYNIYTGVGYCAVVIQSESKMIKGTILMSFHSLSLI